MVAGNWQIRFFPDVGDSVVAIPTLGRVPHLPDGLGPSKGLWGPGIPTRAGDAHQAWNTEQKILTGTLILNRTQRFLVNMATWASKRLAGAGLLCGGRTVFSRANNGTQGQRSRTCSQSTEMGQL